MLHQLKALNVEGSGTLILDAPQVCDRRGLGVVLLAVVACCPGVDGVCAALFERKVVVELRLDGGCGRSHLCYREDGI